MTIEIPDCSAIEFDSQETSLEEMPSFVPQGLASIPDSIHILPKTNIIERLAIHMGLALFHLITATLQFSSWILKTLFGLASRQKALYRELYAIAKKGDPPEIRKFLVEHSEGNCVANFLFSEFLALPELHFYLPEILKGANVCLLNDGGFFCRRWSAHPDSRRRLSSHVYQNQECYEMGHFLFWLDPQGNTRFQFERSPFTGFLSAIHHTIDYLRYKRDNEQQGVMGTSPHTEQYCLKIAVNPEEFLFRIL